MSPRLPVLFSPNSLLLGVLNALKNGRLGAGFPAGLSPTSFHLSPTSCHLSPKLVLVVGFPAGLSPTSFHLSPTSFHSPNRFTCEGFLLLLKGCMLGPDDFEFVSGLVFLAA